MPINSCPVSEDILSISSLGKPFGNTEKSLCVINPPISQCPVVESFPFDDSASFPTIEQVTSSLSPFIFVIAPKPSFSKVGRLSCPFAFATLPKVFAPMSP